MEPTTIAGVLLAQLIANHSLLAELAKKGAEKSAEKLGEHLGERLAKLGQPLLATAKANHEFRQALLSLAQDTSNPAKRKALEAILASLLATNPSLAAELASHLNLPPWFPPQPAERFFGRAELIPQVTDHLTRHHHTTLQGPGGMGKTALAAEVLRRLAPAPHDPGPFPGGIFSHDYYALPDHSAVLTGLLAQAREPELPEAARPARLRQLLDRPGVLLYLEGCEKARALRDLVELAGQAKILFTSRDATQTSEGQPFELPPLDAIAAAHVLNHHAASPALPADDAGRAPWLALAQRLGHHPLALRLAGAWLKRRRKPPADFHQRLDRDGLTFWDDGKGPKQNLATLFQHSAEAAAAKHPRALEAWFALALHGHAPVPQPALVGTLGCSADETEDALGALQDYSLAVPARFPSEQIGQTEPAWQLAHSLLGEWGREDLCRRRREESQTSPPAHPSHATRTEGAFSCRLLPERHDEIIGRWLEFWQKTFIVCFEQRLVLGGRERYQALQPHWEALIASASRAKHLGPRATASFLFMIGSAHHDMGNYRVAEAQLRQGINIGECVWGSDDLRTLDGLNTLGLVLADKGEFGEAEQLHRRTLDARARVLGPNAKDTLISLDNLANLLVSMGDFDHAEPLYQSALEGMERTLGVSHRETLRIADNLGLLLTNKGDLDAAEPLLRRAVSGRERHFGPDHAETLLGLTNFGNFLSRKGDFKQAESLGRRILKTRERTLGLEHPDTLTSIANLGAVLAEQGKLDEAEAQLRRALSIQRLIPGTYLLQFSRIWTNLASLLRRQGDLVGAERLHLQALDGFERSVGRGHPDTLTCVLNLAITSGDKGDFSGAELFASRSVQGLAGKLSANHPLLKRAQEVLRDIHRVLEQNRKRTSQTGEQ